MALPFEPEPLGVLQSRYPAALVELFDAVSIVAHDAERPGQLRKHVFDCEDGLHLIINRERIPSGQIVLHVSASVYEDTPLFAELKAGSLGFPAFKLLCERRFAEISGDTKPLGWLGLLGKKQIPNWYREEGSEHE